ncbi:MAG: magnesium transporter CorA family protein [Dehalococcoidales bacterium]|nr:magnesium transporter CorA family protein [Dehalococcoidales bacterium]
MLEQNMGMKENIRTVTCEDMTWVDVVPPTPEAMKYLGQNYNLQQLTLEDCLSRRQISKMDVFPDHLFFVFHFNHYDKNTRISTKRQWSAFIGENFIITVHTGELRSLVNLFKECQINSESRQKYLSKGSGFLLYQIIDKAVDSYFPVLDKILSLLEQSEDSVFNEDVEATTELSILRRDIITQRMVMLPTRTLLVEMRNRLLRYSRVEITSYYDDLIDHMNKICQTLDECKEVVEVFKDADYSLVTQHLNRVVRSLNIIATVILPFLAISSIFGMNVAMPGGLESGNYIPFVVILAVMVLLTIALMYYFRRRNWN